MFNLGFFNNKKIIIITRKIKKDLISNKTKAIKEFYNLFHLKDCISKILINLKSIHLEIITFAYILFLKR